MSESNTIRIPNDGVLKLARGNSVHLVQNPVFNDIMLLAGNQPRWWKNSHCINQQKLQIRFNFVLGHVCVCVSEHVCVCVCVTRQLVQHYVTACRHYSEMPDQQFRNKNACFFKEKQKQTSKTLQKLFENKRKHILG